MISFVNFAAPQPHGGRSPPLRMFSMNPDQQSGTVDREAETAESTDEVSTVPRDEPTVPRSHLLTLHYPPDTPTGLIDKFPHERVRKLADQKIQLGRGVSVDILLNDTHMPRVFANVWCQLDENSVPRWYIKNVSEKKPVRINFNGTRTSLKHQDEKEIRDGYELKLETLRFIVRTEDGDFDGMTDYELEILPMVDESTSGSSSVNRQTSSSGDSTVSLTSAAALQRPRQGDTGNHGSSHHPTISPHTGSHYGLAVNGHAPLPGGVAIHHLTQSPANVASPGPQASAGCYHQHYSHPCPQCSQPCCLMRHDPTGSQYQQQGQAHGQQQPLVNPGHARHDSSGSHSQQHGHTYGLQHPFHTSHQQGHLHGMQQPFVNPGQARLNMGPSHHYLPGGGAGPPVHGYTALQPPYGPAQYGQPPGLPQASNQHGANQPSLPLGVAELQQISSHSTILNQEQGVFHQSASANMYGPPGVSQQGVQYTQEQLSQQWQYQSQQFQNVTGQQPGQPDRPLPLHGPLSMPVNGATNQRQQQRPLSQDGTQLSQQRPVFIAQPESANALCMTQTVNQPVQPSASAQHQVSPSVVSLQNTQDRENLQTHFGFNRDLPAAPPVAQLERLNFGTPVQVTTPYPTEVATPSVAYTLSHSGSGDWNAASADAALLQGPHLSQILSIQNLSRESAGSGINNTIEGQRVGAQGSEVSHPALMASAGGRSNGNAAGLASAAVMNAAFFPLQQNVPGASLGALSDLTNPASNGNRINLRSHERISPPPPPSADFSTLGSDRVAVLEGAGATGEGIQQSSRRQPQEDDERQPQEHEDQQ